ncbi:MAG: hypothetical protein IRY86_09100 [Thermorudis peleae]|nr:hypothetical protein [Thermorudis peleae]
MRRWITLIAGGLLVVFVVLFVVLYLLGGPNQSALERIRDIAVIFLALSTIIVVLLLGALIGIIIWLALTLRDHIVPLLQTAAEALSRVRGTTEFLGEATARPVIRTYSRIAGLRAMVRTLRPRRQR